MHAPAAPGPASCLCGAIHITFTAPPISVLSCFCRDCAKNGGSTHSVIMALPSSTCTLSDPKGVLKSYATTQTMSGNARTKYFCGDCGVCLYGTVGGIDGCWLLRSSSLDDGEMNKWKPSMELWVKNRPEWVKPVAGAEQVQTQNSFDGLAEAMQAFM
ncbi:Mss4-like protein [Geopyxis carbonaria]|nr:Mss4-like protein [Geopyxis carbonaria]